MFFKLFVAFAVLPVAEIYLLITIGTEIGAMNTVVLVLLSAFVGAWLAREQGTRTMFKIRENLSRGITPAEELIDAFLIFGAGLVLLTPGFITDAAGLLILFPPTRKWFKQWLRKKFDQWIQSGRVNITRYR
ncbi:MAG: FxsA family protein [Desulfovibrionales bacterium]